MDRLGPDKWKDMFCIVREHIWKYRVVHSFEKH